MDNNGTPSTGENAGNASSDKPKNEAPLTRDIGGMTLKKRTPSADGSSPTPSYSGGGHGGSHGGGQQGGGGGGQLVLNPGGQNVYRSGARFGGTSSTPGAPGSRPVSTNVQKRMERFSRVMPTRDPGVRMNESIRVPEIRVIDEEGQVGVMSPREALEIARERGLDLIEIVPNAQPPVCKIIDFGKWKYEQQKRDKLAKKASHQQLLKEVRFHPSTDTHDFEFKVRHARNFLLEGHKVKATVQFKGREVAYKQFGEELLRNFQTRLADVAKVDQDVSMMGKMMTMMLSPTAKKKKETPKADGAAPAKPKKQKGNAELVPEEAIATDEGMSEEEIERKLMGDDAEFEDEGTIEEIGSSEFPSEASPSEFPDDGIDLEADLDDDDVNQDTEEAE